MAEETWHAARLIPTSGINGAEEQERRATSALLAVMSAVREFGRTITTPLGAPAGNVETYIEVPFDLNGQRVFPDGLIRVTRGQRTWTALVEVKTHTNVLVGPQLEGYLDVARENGFDAVLTISNEIPSVLGGHPTTVDKRKLRKVALHHLSWTQVLTEAVVQKEHRGVSDPDQAWILAELIRYLEHPRSGAMEFEDMGPAWVDVREAVRTGTLRQNDKSASEVVARWDQLVQYVGLRLGRQLGVAVRPALTRQQLADPSSRTLSLLQTLCTTGHVDGGLRIPSAAADLIMTADLRGQLVSVAMTVEAPKDGRPLTKVRWLMRQLSNAPDGLRVDAFAVNSRGLSMSALLKDVRLDQTTLLDQNKRDLRSFRLTMSAPMGAKRGQGRSSFVGSVVDLVDAFYAEVVRSVKPWSAAAPPIRDEAPPPTLVDVTVPDSLVSTSLSSQDGPAETPAEVSETSEGRSDDGDVQTGQLATNDHVGEPQQLGATDGGQL